MFLIILITGILGAGILIFFVYRASKRSVVINAPVTTDNDPQRIDPDYVLVSFMVKGKQIQHEYFYDKNIYKTPQDFCQLHKLVTVKYDPENPENFIVTEEKKGEYTSLIASAVIGIAIGAVAASNETGSMMEKTKVFLIWASILTLVSFLIVKLNSYFSFLNILTKRDE